MAELISKKFTIRIDFNILLKIVNYHFEMYLLGLSEYNFIDDSEAY